MSDTTETMTATDARGRKLTLQALQPDGLLDLLEAGGAAANSEPWLRYATIVCSVTEIDGVPVPRARTREQIKQAARTIGNDGMAAAVAALFGNTAAPAGADVDAAGNSPATP